MDVPTPTQVFLLALLVAHSLESAQPEMCPPHMDTFANIGTRGGYTQAQVRNGDGDYIKVPVHGCGSVCNVETEIQTHIIAQNRPRNRVEEIQKQPITVNLEDTCRAMPTPAGRIKPQNVSILLVLFVWSWEPVEYRLVYKENCGIHITGIYLVQIGISRPGGTQDTLASTVTLPDHHRGEIKVFNATFRDDLITGESILADTPPHSIFMTELLPRILKDVEEQFLLASGTMSTGSVSFADIASEWFLDVGQGCCGSAELGEKSRDAVHVSPRIHPFTTPTPAGSADATHIYDIMKLVVPLAIFMFSAAVYVVAVYCQQRVAAFAKSKKLNSTVQPVYNVTTVAHVTELQHVVTLPSYEEVLRISLQPVETVNLGPPPTYDEQSAGVVTYI